MPLLVYTFCRMPSDTCVIADILGHEFSIVASIVTDKSGPALVSDRERDLGHEMQELAEQDIINNAEKPSETEASRKAFEISIRYIVFHCWMFCGRIDAWDWKSEDIWESFKKSRGKSPIYEWPGK